MHKVKSFYEIVRNNVFKQMGAVTEYRFHPVRKWRADYAFEKDKVLVEIEGGAFSKGRHTRGPGFINDMEKYNAAIELGYYVLRYTPQNIDYEQIRRVLNARATQSI